MDSWFLERPIAHRGLHFDNEIPENSISAFQKAIDNGYPIELDIQITKDHEVVVFHDESLLRICGVNKKVSELNLSELKKFKLFESSEKIPTLRETLEFVNARVPLLIELKCLDYNGILEKQTAKDLDSYSGQIAIQSFHPFSLFWFKRNREHIPRGMLCGSLQKSGLGFGKKLLVKSLVLSLFIKPQFLALEYGWHKPWKSLLCLSLPIVYWTITKSEEVSRIETQKNRNYIFEKVLPKS